MYKLRFLPIAKNDIQNIVDYYDEVNPTLSDAFLVELEQTIVFIQSSPKACKKQLGNIRVSYLKRFWYGVFFKIYDRQIVVLGVLHTSRDPQIWKRRQIEKAD